MKRILLDRGSTRQNFSKKNLGGFTVVEMIVSVGLFTIVLFMATSAFLTIVNADRKSRAVRIAVDNLNLALEDMQRRIKTGSNYYCGTSTDTTAPIETLDCSGTGSTTMSFTEQDGVTRTIYAYDPVSKAIYRESHGASVFYTGETMRMTASEIKIDSVRFMVRGSTPGFTTDVPVGDSTQAYVTIIINGSIPGATPTSFNIQTMITQRNYDS